MSDVISSDLCGPVCTEDAPTEKRLRRGKLTEAQLRQLANEYQKLADSYRGFASKAAAKGTPLVDGLKNMELGLTLAKRGLANVEIGFINLETRG